MIIKIFLGLLLCVISIQSFPVSNLYQQEEFGTIYLTTNEILSLNLQNYITGTNIDWITNNNHEKYVQVQNEVTSNIEFSGILNNLIAIAIFEDEFGEWIPKTNFAILDAQNTLSWATTNFEYNQELFPSDQKHSLANSNNVSCFDMKYIAEQLLVIDCFSNHTNYFYFFNITANETTLTLPSVPGKPNGNESNFTRSISVITYMDRIYLFRAVILSHPTNNQPLANTYIEVYEFLEPNSIQLLNILNSSSVGDLNFNLVAIDSFQGELFAADLTGLIYRFYNVEVPLNFEIFNATTYPTPIIGLKIRSDMMSGIANVMMGLVTFTEIYLIEWTIKNNLTLIETFWNNEEGFWNLNYFDFSVNFLALVMNLNGESYQSMLCLFERGSEFNTYPFFQTKQMILSQSILLRGINIIFNANPGNVEYFQVSPSFLRIGPFSNIEINQTITFYQPSYITLFYNVIEPTDCQAYLTQQYNITNFNLQNGLENQISINGYFSGPNLTYAFPNSSYLSYSERNISKIINSLPNSIVFLQANVDYVYLQDASSVLTIYQNVQGSLVNPIQINIEDKIELFTCGGLISEFYAYTKASQSNQIIINTVGSNNNFNISTQSKVCQDIKFHITSRDQIILICPTGDDALIWNIEQTNVTYSLSSLIGYNIEASSCQSINGIDIIYFKTNNAEITQVNVGYLLLNGEVFIYNRFSLQDIQNDFDFFLMNNTVVAISISANQIQEYDITIPNQVYFKKNYYLPKYTITNTYSYSSLSGNIAIFVQNDQVSQLFIYKSNQAANSNLYIAETTQTIPQLVSMASFPFNDKLFAVQNEELSQYTIPADAYISVTATIPPNSKLFSLNASLVASNCESSQAIGLSFQVWSPEVSINTIYQPENSEKYFQINQPNSRIENISYPFNDSMFFNGTRLTYSLNYEQPSDSQFIFLSPRVYINGELLINGEILDMLPINTSTQIMTNQELIQLSATNNITDKFQIPTQEAPYGILTDWNTEYTYLISFDNLLGINYVRIFDNNLTLINNFSIFCSLPLYNFQIISYKIWTYLFALESPQKLIVYNLEYNEIILSNAVWVIEIDEISLQTNSLNIEDYDVFPLPGGFRIVMADKTVGLRNVDLNVKGALGRVFPGHNFENIYNIVAFSSTGFLTSEYATSVYVLSANVENVELLLGTSLHTYYVNWENLENINQPSNISLIQYFIAYGKAESSNMAVLNDYLFILTNTEEETNLLIYNFESSENHGNGETIFGVIKTNYYDGNINPILVQNTENNEVIIPVPISAGLSFVITQEIPIITLSNGEVSSEYIIVTASNLVSSSSVTIYLDNLNPAPTPAEKTETMLIILELLDMHISNLRKGQMMMIDQGKLAQQGPSRRKHQMKNMKKSKLREGLPLS